MTFTFGIFNLLPSEIVDTEEGIITLITDEPLALLILWRTIPSLYNIVFATHTPSV